MGKGNKRNEKIKVKRSKYQDEIDELNKEVLKKIGMEIKSVKSDGNCLWRSISCCMDKNNDENNYLFYKSNVLKFVESNKSYFSPFLEDIDSYIDKMKLEKAWGGDMELFAFSKCFGCNVVIFILGKPNLSFNDGTVGVKTIYLSYHLGEHYNAVLPLKIPVVVGVGPLKQVKKLEEKNEKEIAKKNLKNEFEKYEKQAKELEKIDEIGCDDVSILPKEQVEFIKESSGCNNEEYIQELFLKCECDVMETIMTLSMEKNIYLTKKVKEEDMWKDVKIKSKKILSEVLQKEPVEEVKLKKSHLLTEKPEFVDVKIQPPKLSKTQQKKLERQKKEEQKQNYLTTN